MGNSQSVLIFTTNFMTTQPEGNVKFSLGTIFKLTLASSVSERRYTSKRFPGVISERKCLICESLL